MKTHAFHFLQPTIDDSGIMRVARVCFGQVKIARGKSRIVSMYNVL